MFFYMVYNQFMKFFFKLMVSAIDFKTHFKSAELVFNKHKSYYLD